MARKPGKKQKEIQKDALGKVDIVKGIYKKRKRWLVPLDMYFVMNSREEALNNESILVKILE